MVFADPLEIIIEEFLAEASLSNAHQMPRQAISKAGSKGHGKLGTPSLLNRSKTGLALAGCGNVDLKGDAKGDGKGDAKGDGKGDPNEYTLRQPCRLNILPTAPVPAAMQSGHDEMAVPATEVIDISGDGEGDSKGHDKMGTPGLYNDVTQHAQWLTANPGRGLDGGGRSVHRRRPY